MGTLNSWYSINLIIFKLLSSPIDRSRNDKNTELKDLEEIIGISFFSFEIEHNSLRCRKIGI